VFVFWKSQVQVTLQYCSNIGLADREGKYCSCVDVKVVRTMKEVMLGHFSRIITRTFWVGA